MRRLHRGPCALWLGLGLARVVSRCAPLLPHPATAGEKGAAAAGATLCPEADLSRLKVDRAALLKKIKAREALSDNERECVHLGLVARGAPTRTAAPTHFGLAVSYTPLTLPTT